MKRAVLVAILAGGVFVSCRDQQSVTALKPGLSADFSDGRSTGGNPHFFFLPPLVPQPTFSGVFNPQIQPVVDICLLDLTLSPVDCAQPGQHINPGPVVIDAPEQYHVNWDTRQPAIDTTKFYRIQVFGSPDGLRLGFADMDPVGNGSQLKNVNTNQYIGLVDGRTLPIRFRIERGAFLPGFTCTDCAEANVTNDGATVVTNTGFAGVQFPAGWLTSPSNVVVTIERVTSVNGVPLDNGGGVTARCIPLLQTQFEGCYRFKTSPLATFATNVTVGVCATVSEPDHDVIQLFSVEEPVDEVPVIRALPNVPAPFVSCGGFASAASSGAWLAGLVRHVEALFTPTPAFAFHLGAGGSACCFSRIGWFLPAGGLMNFDLDRTGSSITPGTVVDTTYSLLGVTFGRTKTDGLCAGTHLFANDNGPLSEGFGFASGNNVVTICPEGTASDFSENSGGRIVAQLSGAAAQVCLEVWVTGFQPGSQPGATGFLEAFDEHGTSLGKVVSDPNAFGQTLCSSAGNITSVQFAGSGDGFAEFDNLNVTFVAPPPNP